MNAFPAFFPLAGRTVVIVGEGDAAEAKARLFDGSPARLVRLAADAALDPAGYAGAALVFVAGGEAAFQAAARDAAKAAGAPVNVVDRPALCDFTTPAVIDRGELVAAVSTGGAAPMLAALVRNDIEARLPEGAGRLAALLGAMQAELRAALPRPAARRAFLREALGGPAAAAAMAGDAAGAQALLRATLAAQRAGGGGRICAIAMPRAADLISLRAARRLAEADVLVIEPAAAALLAGLARRDARRIEPALADLQALAGEGELVVVAPPPPPADLARLRAAGVAVELLQAADAS